MSLSLCCQKSFFFFLLTQRLSCAIMLMMKKFSNLVFLLILIKPLSAVALLLASDDKAMRLFDTSMRNKFFFSFSAMTHSMELCRVAMMMARFVGISPRRLSTLLCANGKRAMRERREAMRCGNGVRPAMHLKQLPGVERKN